MEVGGAEMALYRLILDSRGGPYSHTVISLTLGGTMGQRFHRNGIDLTYLDLKHSPIEQFIRLLTIIRKTQPDIVQTWMYHADMVGGLAARLAGVQHVIWGIRTTKVTAGSCSRVTAVIRQICAWLSRWVPDTIVCVAEASLQAHVVIGYDPVRMVVVRNGFDFSDFVTIPGQRTMLREQCGFAADDVVIGSVGRFNTDKDYHNFVRAAGQVAQRHGHARFLMVGPGLDARNMELAAWIADAGHADRFVLLGERTDIPACLAAMDIFCLSSRNEGFPNVVGEAMAMGLPCVATDVGDVVKVLADTGLVVPKEDAGALALALGSVIEMACGVRLDLGRKAKERVHAEFTMDRAREGFETIYQYLMEKGGR
jgi:glycosyltransferase involved in cell wall biosynthesis